MMNEQDCHHLVSDLVTASRLDVIPLLGSEKFITLEHLLDMARDFLEFSGGRVTSHELQSFLNVDMFHADKVIQQMLIDSSAASPLQFLGGELITKDYLDNLKDEITHLVERHRRKYFSSSFESGECSLTIGSLVAHFGLPLETITALVKAHFPEESIFRSSAAAIPITTSSQENDNKRGKKKKREKEKNAEEPLVSSSNNSCSVSHSGSVEASVYGYCMGAILPLSISKIRNAFASILSDDASVLNILLNMTSGDGHNDSETSHPLVLPGVCNNKEYIPHIFSNQQRLQIDDYFRVQNWISFSRLQSLDVNSKQKEYITASFSDAIPLDTCVISGVFLDVFKTSVEDVVNAFPWGNNDAGDASNIAPPWLSLTSSLPDQFNERDIELLLKAVGSDVNSKSCDVLLLCTARAERYMLNRQFLKYLEELILEDASSATTAEKMSIACVQQSSASQHATNTSGHASISTSVKPVIVSSKEYDDEEEGMGKGKKSRQKKGTSRKQNTDADVEESEGKTSKKGGKRGKDKDVKKKQSGVNASASSNNRHLDASNEGQDVASVLSAPFVAKTHIFPIFLKKCSRVFVDTEELLDFLSDSNDDACFDGDSASGSLPLLESIYEYIFRSVSKAYSAVAEKVLQSTTQGTHDLRMKRELNRDQRFGEYWIDLQVASKVLTSFEKDCPIDSPLYDQLFLVHSYILSTKCAPIASLLTEFCCWEHDVECPVVVTGKITLLYDQRQLLQKHLPQDCGNLLSKLWKSLGYNDHGTADRTATVWSFIDIVSSSTFKTSLNLIVHKIDKKKEKSMSFACKQRFMDGMKIEKELNLLCPLVLSMAVYQLTNSVLELPPMAENGNDDNHPLFSFVLDWLSPPRIPQADYDAIISLIEERSQSATVDQAMSICDAAKLAVLKKFSS